MLENIVSEGADLLENQLSNEKNIAVVVAAFIYLYLAII